MSQYEQQLTHVQNVSQLPVVDSGDYRRAVEHIANIKQLREQIDATFDPILTKQRELVELTRQQKKKFTEPLDEAERDIRGGIKRYLKEAAQATLNASLEVNDEDADIMSLVPISNSSVPAVQGVTQLEEWKFEVADEKAVPREFLMLDLAKIRTHIRRLKSLARIPGIKVFSNTAVRIRGKR